MSTNRCWYFNKRPTQHMETDTLVLRDEARPVPAEGQFLLRSIYLSMDATNRLWLSDMELYMDTIKLGQPMMGFMVGEIVQSNHPDFPVGATAAGLAPWAEYSLSNGEGFSLMPEIPGLSLDQAFGVLAIAGPTAYVGLMEVGRPKPGSTVVVSAAAGAVGMLVGQIAKLHGCKTIGIAGGAEKCGWLTSEFGYDHAIDYKSENVLERLRELAPEGIDLNFENVGGETLDACLTHMKDFGTVVVCGLISTYNSTAGDKIPGPYMFRNVIMKRLRIEGFVILDYIEKLPELQQKIAGWMLEGKIRARLHVNQGLENAVDTLELLYTGGNKGKVMLQIGDLPGQPE